MISLSLTDLRKVPRDFAFPQKLAVLFVAQHTEVAAKTVSTC